MNIKAIDICCGAGGLSYGLKLAGIKVLAGFDNVAHCHYPFTHNTGGAFVCDDIREVNPLFYNHLWSEDVDKFRLLVGSPPCRTFSRFDKRRNNPDPNRDLVGEFARMIEGLNPNLVAIELVKKYRNAPEFLVLLEYLRRKKFYVCHDILRATDYGVPQLRDRLYVLGSKFAPIEFADPVHMPRRSVRDAIADLPPLTNGAADPFDSLHRTVRLHDTDLARCQIATSTGTWRDWPIELQPKRFQGKTGYNELWRRIPWDSYYVGLMPEFFEPSNGAAFHPDQDRSISMREAARIQAFPDSFQWEKKKGDAGCLPLSHMIAKATPTPVAIYIGIAMQYHANYVTRYLAPPSKGGGNLSPPL